MKLDLKRGRNRSAQHMHIETRVRDIVRRQGGSRAIHLRPYRRASQQPADVFVGVELDDDVISYGGVADDGYVLRSEGTHDADAFALRAAYSSPTNVDASSDSVPVIAVSRSRASGGVPPMTIPDWMTAATSGDSFVRVVNGYLDDVKAGMVARIDLRHAPANLRAWFRTVFLDERPRIAAAADTIRLTPQEIDHVIWHHMYAVMDELTRIVNAYLEQGRVWAVDSVCRPSSRSLAVLTRRCVGELGGWGFKVQYEGMNHLVLATGIDWRSFQGFLCSMAQWSARAIAEANSLKPVMVNIVLRGGSLCSAVPVGANATDDYWEASIGQQVGEFGIVAHVDAETGLMCTLPSDFLAPAPALLTLDELTPELLLVMTPAGRLVAAERMFDWVDAICAEAARRMLAVVDGDESLDALQAWFRTCIETFEHLARVIKERLPRDLYRRYALYASSWWQPLQSIASGLRDYGEALRYDLDGSSTANRDALLQNRPRRIEVHDRSIYVSQSRSELVGMLQNVLHRHAQTSRWDGDVWEVTLPHEGVIDDQSHSILHHIPWPPTTQDLAPIARIGNWYLEATVTDDTVTFRINFLSALVARE